MLESSKINFETYSDRSRTQQKQMFERQQKK